MKTTTDTVLEKLNEALETKNNQVLKDYAEIKKNNIWLSEDEFSHYKFLNSLSCEFFQNNSFNYDADKEGFLCFAEKVGQNHFLGMLINISQNLDLDGLIDETFTYQKEGHKITSQKLLNKKVILLSLLNDESRPMISKAIISYYLIETEKCADAKDQQFSRLFQPLGPICEKLPEDKRGFFALLDETLDFSEIKNFKDVHNEVCDEWVEKTKIHNAKIRQDLMNLKGENFEI